VEKLHVVEMELA